MASGNEKNSLENFLLDRKKPVVIDIYSNLPKCVILPGKRRTDLNNGKTYPFEPDKIIRTSHEVHTLVVLFTLEVGGMSYYKPQPVGRV